MNTLYVSRSSNEYTGQTVQYRTYQVKRTHCITSNLIFSAQKLEQTQGESALGPGGARRPRSLHLHGASPALRHALPVPL